MHPLCVAITCLACLLRADGGTAAEPIRVLVLDGQNVHHSFKPMSDFMKEILESSGCRVDITRSPARVAPLTRPASPEQLSEYERKQSEVQTGWDRWRPDFSRYQVVISNYSGDAWPEAVRASFVAFVADGGGFLCIHAANNPFNPYVPWPEYDQMVGLGWRPAKHGSALFFDQAGMLQRLSAGQGASAGHGKQHEYTVMIRDHDHPITAGLPALWMHAEDELYHGQRGPAENMHILASAYDDRSIGGTGLHEPVLWTVSYGKGRVVTNVMGHQNGKALQCVGFVTVLRRSVEWLATGAVTAPVPEDFPTADHSRLIASTSGIPVTK